MTYKGLKVPPSPKQGVNITRRLIAIHPPVVITVLQDHSNPILKIKIHSNPVHMITFDVDTIPHVFRAGEVFTAAD